MTPDPDCPLARRTTLLLTADPRRVAARLFLPGQELAAPGVSRAAGVVARCQAMSDHEVNSALDQVRTDYGARHRDLTTLLEEHFRAIAHRVPEAAGVPADRRLLIGAFFTREISVESAALFNPSVVAHPVQDAGGDALRFVMSARAVSEGHLSTIVFRSGTVTPQPGAAGDAVTLDPPSPQVVCAVRHSGPAVRDRLRREAVRSGADPESLDFVLATVGPDVDDAALDRAITSLRQQRLTRRDVEGTIASLRQALRASYEVTFPADSALSERTLFPEIEVESHGMEDARFVRFTEPDGRVGYLATYTGFDGSEVVSRRLETDDFVTFRSAPLTGPAAMNKGMALFPRMVGDRHLALSRWDRENNAIASSRDGFHWEIAAQLQAPSQDWEIIQLGNCGPPLETEAGWLVLTHGVGAMRSYALGALLLDLDDPSTVIGRLTEPLLRAQQDERDGYVPNVVYSCGALIHQQTLLLPYGCSDTSIRLALVDLPTLLRRLRNG
jgi:predicted GH43/DUF377 family glycosyl hydrolase